MSLLRSFGTRLVARLVILGVIAAGAAGVYLVQQIQLKTAQSSASSAYGDDLIGLCKSVQRVPAKASTTIGGKLVFIDSNNSVIATTYHDVMPPARRAAQRAEVEGLVCVRESEIGIQTIPYDKGYTCVRTQRAVDVFLVDAKSGKTVNFRQFQGSAPPDCPQTIRVSNGVNQTPRVYGDAPATADVINWLTGLYVAPGSSGGGAEDGASDGSTDTGGTPVSDERPTLPPSWTPRANVTSTPRPIPPTFTPRPSATPTGPTKIPTKTPTRTATRTRTRTPTPRPK